MLKGAGLEFTVGFGLDAITVCEALIMQVRGTQLGLGLMGYTTWLQ